MKKIFLTTLFIILTTIIYAQKTRYDIYATCTMNVDSGELTSDVVQNFIKIILENNTLMVGNSNTYNLYNKKTTADGFVIIERYDAIDKYQQRCKILFSTDNSADWSTKFTILIAYENKSIAMMYLSNEPKTDL